jgi:hypothetical protein
MTLSVALALRTEMRVQNWVGMSVRDRARYDVTPQAGRQSEAGRKRKGWRLVIKPLGPISRRQPELTSYGLD